MKSKLAVFAVITAFLCIFLSSASRAVDTQEIGRVRDKGVLDSQDFQIIDNFVAEAAEEMVETRDFTSISKLRTTILTYSSSNSESAAAQYSDQFAKSANKYIPSAFERASGLNTQEHQFKAKLNLLMLVDGLEDIQLLDSAMSRLNDANAVLRYWAVHCVTNRGITSKLNSSEPGKVKASEIIKALSNGLEGFSSEALGLIVDFAANIDVRGGADLLIKTADVRISKYADWSVENELLDIKILKLLADKLREGDSASGQRFAQLYSYVLQRYVKGSAFLSENQISQLVSILVEIEVSSVSKLLDIPQSTIKKAIEQDGNALLVREHDRLLGSATSAGELPSKFNFNYGDGENSNEGERTAPIELPEPPAKKKGE
ncbi:MAG: hypothetical protein ACYS18_08175 [Planctomycetota bacterium]|jgi:hypothetical protein